MDRYSIALHKRVPPLTNDAVIDIANRLLTERYKQRAMDVPKRVRDLPEYNPEYDAYRVMFREREDAYRHYCAQRFMMENSHMQVSGNHGGLAKRGLLPMTLSRYHRGFDDPHSSADDIYEIAP